MIIKLVRHGESLHNVGGINAQLSGDHDIPLTAVGHQQARQAGKKVGPDFIENALIYCSPYKRAKVARALPIATTERQHSLKA
jgi:broad specificity phosphatase PhoE